MASPVQHEIPVDAQPIVGDAGNVLQREDLTPACDFEMSENGRTGSEDQLGEVGTEAGKGVRDLLRCAAVARKPGEQNGDRLIVDLDSTDLPEQCWYYFARRRCRSDLEDGTYGVEYPVEIGLSDLNLLVGDRHFAALGTDSNIGAVASSFGLDSHRIAARTEQFRSSLSGLQCAQLQQRAIGCLRFRVLDERNLDPLVGRGLDETEVVAEHD